MFGKIANANCGRYNGIWMRSSYEMKYAKYLDNQGIKWLYESKTFDLGNTTYTPDFYLPNKNQYIEIKGYWRKGIKEKFNLFKILYPQINIKIIMKEDLINLGVL